MCLSLFESEHIIKRAITLVNVHALFEMMTDSLSYSYNIYIYIYICNYVYVYTYTYFNYFFFWGGGGVPGNSFLFMVHISYEFSSYMWITEMARCFIFVLIKDGVHMFLNIHFCTMDNNEFCKLPNILLEILYFTYSNNVDDDGLLIIIALLRSYN